MNLQLSNEEKIQILESIIKSMILTKYKTEAELGAEKILDTASEEWIRIANQQISDLSVKIEYLENMKNAI